ncbi:MAG TPA: Fur family transcriptional regulator [Anaerolineaceae bacterium]|nr:Fur family transcriptional regulator [Anaerolineaceae bacterium]
MKPFRQQVVSQIHARGGRMTAQRQLILTALEDLDGHPTVEEIFTYVQKQDPTINLSTVYRTLKWLEDQGLINAQWFDEKRHKHRFDSVDAQDHYHFCCRECQRIIEFPEPLVAQIKSAFERQSGAKVMNASLVLTGICPDCLSNHQS